MHVVVHRIMFLIIDIQGIFCETFENSRDVNFTSNFVW